MRIQKFLFQLFLILATFASSVFAQFDSEKYKRRFQIFTSAGVSTGFSAEGRIKTIFPENWQNNFKPASQGMTTSTKTTGRIIEGYIAFEPMLRLVGGFRIGGMLVLPFSGDRNVSTSTLTWWDPVTLQDTQFKIVSKPNFGFAVSQDILAQGKVQLFAKMYFLQSEMRIRDYAGKDCFGCTNTSHVNSTTNLPRQNGQTIQVGIGYKLFGKKIPFWIYGGVAQSRFGYGFSGQEGIFGIFLRPY